MPRKGEAAAPLNMTWVPGVGSCPSRLMIVADAPNKEDANKRRPFSGRTGQELDRFMDGYHLPPRSSCYVTHLFKHQIEDKRDPSPELLAEHEKHLMDELRDVQPAVIVPMGKNALQWLLGDRYSIAVRHGIATGVSPDSKAFGIVPKAVVMPAMHPGAGFSNPDLYRKFVFDMHRLELLLTGKLPSQPLDDGVGHYELLQGAQVSAVLRNARGPVSVDTEGLLPNAWSLQFSTMPGIGYMVRATDAEGLEAFASWLKAVRPLVVFHFAQHDIAVLRGMGVDIIAWGIPFTCTMVMAYLVSEEQGLKALGYRLAGMGQEEYMELVRVPGERVAREWLERLAWQTFPRFYGPKPEPREKALRLVERMLMKEGARGLRERWDDCRAREVLQDELQLVDDIPEPTLDLLPLADAIQYGCRDTDVGIRIYPVLDEMIDTLGVRGVLEVDLSIVPMVERMQTVGMGVDLEYLRDLGQVFEQEYILTLRMIEQAAGRPINPMSGDEVAKWLFEDMQLPWKKKTKAGDRPSTDRKVLEALSKNYDDVDDVSRRNVSLLLEAKEIAKLKNTYCDTIAQWVKANGRLHPRLLLTRTGTGRTAAKDPNILAFPKHSARGKLIRGGFIPAPGRELGEWDLDQIEMKVMAIDSGDERMLAEFRSGMDKHTSTAAMIFKRDVKELTAAIAAKDEHAKDQRFGAKCFHPDTEVLTKAGWKVITALASGEEIIQAHPKGDGEVSMSWVVPTAAFTLPATDGLVHLHNEGMDLRVTPDHRMLAWGASGNWFVDTPEAFHTRADIWANAGVLAARSGQKLPSEVVLRLAVALQADGSIQSSGVVTWGFSKVRKIERLTRLLTEAGLPFTTGVCSNGDNKPTTWFRLSKGYGTRISRLLDADKTLPWGWLNYPLTQRLIVLDEARYWDGHVEDAWQAFAYYAKPQKNRDVLQALASVSGFKTRDNGVMHLTVRARATSRAGSLSVTRLPYDGPVTCVSVPSSFVLVRDGGVPVVVGQCVNFGILMGITEHGLLDQFHKHGSHDWTESRCVDLLAAWHRAYPQASAYISNKHAEARRFGYVRDMWGRLRYLEGVHSSDKYARAEALRMAQATPIQSGARGIVKRWMAAIWQRLPALQAIHWVEPILDVHDAVMFEFDSAAYDELDRLVQDALSTVQGFPIAITAKGDRGANWGEL